MELLARFELATRSIKTGFDGALRPQIEIDEAASFTYLK